MLEKVWRDLEQPHRLNFNYVAHELFSSENQLIIDDPLWLVFEEAGVGVHMDNLRGVGLAF